jgi:hypothetical protein
MTVPRQNGPAADAAFRDYDVARFNVETARQLAQLPDPPAEHALLGPLVYRGHRTILVGDTGHGKTSLALRMLGAIVAGGELLGHAGAGVGPALVLDLEQGIRSIKRGLIEAGLDERDDVLYVRAPDGLALDQEPTHLAALNEALAEHRPSVLLLDPYYKAHRADDPNSERAIVDLMRQLDALRVIYEFALILPAHPRKPDKQQHGARALTVHDVSGSGAVTRGAEIVLGLERLGHGAARLRYLKDRDGDLPVGDAEALLYDREHGFRLNPRAGTTDDELEQKVLEAPRPWLTVKEWAGELGVRESNTKRVLEQLAARPDSPVVYMLGPPGRSAKAQCYSTAPDARAQSGEVTQLPLDSSTAPTTPTSLIGEVSSGRSQTSPTTPGAVDLDDPWIGQEEF